MMAEVKQVKRYLGARFGYGEVLPDGVYAVPTLVRGQNGFMRIEIQKGEFAGTKNFNCYWDEAMTIRAVAENETVPVDSPFAAAFRNLEAVRP